VAKIRLQGRLRGERFFSSPLINAKLSISGRGAVTTGESGAADDGHLNAIVVGLYRQYRHTDKVKAAG
jgi:hypothetical protein